MPARSRERDKDQPPITKFFHKADPADLKPKHLQALKGNAKLTRYYQRLHGVQKYKAKQHYSEVHRFFLGLKLLSTKPDATRSRRGFCFVASSNFTEYHVYTAMTRTVIVDGKYMDIPAGTCVATAQVDDDSALEHIDVKSTFRRQGIGTHLIKFLVDTCPQFHVYLDQTNNSRYRLTGEGAALITACRSREILSYDQVIEASAPPSPSVTSSFG